MHRCSDLQALTLSPAYCSVLTPSCLVHTWLLPQLYSPLSTLYLLCDGSLPQLSYPLPSSALSPHLIPSSFLVSPRDSCSSLHPLLCKGQNSSMACDKQYWQHLCAWNVLPDYKILQKLDIERWVLNKLQLAASFIFRFIWFLKAYNYWSRGIYSVHIARWV